MKKVLKKRKDVVFFIKLYPLKMHKDAQRKSESIQCEYAKDPEKGLKMLEDAFAKRSIPDPVCKTDVIEGNIKLAERLGITGTPTLILQDGRVLSGALKAEQIIELLEKKHKDR